jgi:Flp pilus assembly pilin Flp
VSSMFARIRVDSTSAASSIHDFNARVARSRCPKGGESIVTFTDLVEYLRARFEGEKGQTMAEYGVVLAVITIGVFLALGALSGAISGAITTVTGYL